MSSDAIAINRISRIVGYKIVKGDFSTVTPNLPQRIAVLGEANDANQSTLDLTPTKITSAQQAGLKYGWGSPLYLICRILLPTSGGGVAGNAPVWVYPQAKAAGALPKIVEIAPSGNATDNGTHTIKIGGREGLEGVFYNVDIVAGDTPTVISQKITDAVNNVLGSPVTGVDHPYYSALTTKWSGLTANDLKVSVDTNGNDCGITYSFPVIQAGSGTPSVQAQLDNFGNDWNTIVVNGYGTVTSVMTALETFNGITDPDSPTGRYQGIIMKPFIAITGSVAEDPSSLTDGRLNDVTIAIAPAPLSEGFPFEAAANMTVLFANVSQNTPHLDVAGKSYPDMPTPTAIGAMAIYNNRDEIVQKGCSTVDLVKGKYLMEDFVTTYHPVGETPPQFRYCRNLMIDLNIRYGYYLLEQINVVDHAIAADEDTVNAVKVIKPKQWKQILNGYADDLALRALIVQPDFMKNSLDVTLSATNPDRLDTNFKTKRSGFVRESSTTVTTGFNFGTV